MKKLPFLAAFLSAVTASAGAFADSGYVGMAKPWEMDLQPPVTPVMDRLYAIHNHLLLPIITAITIFVLLVMVYICLRFNRKRNPVPSKTAHNTRLEIIWTAVPILILVAIAVPSLRIHYYMERIVNPDLTVKVTGHQWYWHYDYPDNGNFGFDSYILQGKDLKPGDIRQLSVDNAMVVPVNTKVRLLITGADVIHSWAMPSFGIKRDAIPGRLNDSWFEADRTGTFYGQCSQLCGVGHGFMPIEVKVVSKEDFASWVKQHAPAPAAAPAPAEKQPEQKAEEKKPEKKAEKREEKKTEPKKQEKP